MTNKYSSGLFPVLALLLSASMWGLLWYPLRLLQEQGLSQMWVTLAAYLAAAMLGLVLFRRHFRFLLQSPLRLLLVALFSGWTNIAFILAIVDGNLVRVILLFYLSPVWTVILGRIFLREKVTLPALLVLVLAVIGAIIMLWDPAAGSIWPLNNVDLLAISSGMSFAATNVTVRSLEHIPVPIKSLVNWIGAIVIAVLVILWQGHSIPVAPASAWGWSVVLGIFGFMIMTLAVIYGVSHMPVHRSAVILLSEIVVVAVSQQMLTNETLGRAEIIGGIIIVSATLVEAFWQMRSRR